MLTKIRVGTEEVELPARRPDESDATFDQVNFILSRGLLRDEELRYIGRDQAAHLIRYARSTPAARAERRAEGIRIALGVAAVLFFIFWVLPRLLIALGGQN